MVRPKSAQLSAKCPSSYEFLLRLSRHILEHLFLRTTPISFLQIYQKKKVGIMKLYVSFLSMSFSKRNDSDYTKELVAKL